MKALISPLEKIGQGYRVAQLAVVEFPVCAPLFWVDCDDELLGQPLWYDPVDQTIKIIPEPVPPEELEQPQTEGTQEL
jgi:hypothetical protein